MRELSVIAWLVLCFGCASGQNAPPNPAPSPTPATEKAGEPQSGDRQSIQIGRFTLTLNDCRLNYETAGKTHSFQFEFAEPCRFSQDQAGETRVVKFKNASVIAVESSQPPNAASGKSSASDCDTRIRGVVVTKNAVRLSAQTQRVAMCLPFVWDEKMFVTFAARTVDFDE